LHPFRFTIIALACLVVGGLGGLAVAVAHKPEAAAPVRFLPPPTAPPQFVLHDQDGRRLSPADARGDVLILTFLYSTCRTLCPAQAQEIKNAVGKAGVTNFQVYGVSVDPVGDTTRNAQLFLKHAGLVNPRVHFLLGTRRELSAVWQQYGIVPINATPQEAEAAAAAYDWQHRAHRSDKHGAKAAAYAHCPGGAAGYEQFKAASDDGQAQATEKGCYEDQPPPAAEEPYPDTSDGRYRGRPRHGSWDFEHSAYVLLIDKTGRQRVGFPFEQLTSERLAEDIRTLAGPS
jgi:cytochrome oxidase Cu insertion factor (SCO1/SenC/PrrC family)